MNLPNALTIGRLLLAGVLLLVMSVGRAGVASVAVVIVLAAAATDWLDGHLARAGHGVTLLGQLLDPLADKVLVCAALVSLVETRLPGAPRGLVPAWVVVVILAREFLVTGLRILAGRSGRDISAESWGKHKTIGQIVVILVIFAGLALYQDVLPAVRPAAVADFGRVLQRGAYLLSLAAAAMTVASGLLYLRRHRDLLRG
ncbi:MAG: CDP-diacylglycerol--glycerol-3-phosphate 3-phosphatidyltransferase [Kiritimatiellae bacterium]|nr:CDP-diacylglycerol--glycerol-3-phosphate 3-phosphatidyltransferase [Kiritimatiellia bacterium]